MRKLISCILLFAFAAIATQAMTNTWCVVKLKDGSQQSYVIRGKMTITPTPSSIIFSSASLETTYTLSNVLSYSFLTQEEVNAITPASTPDVRIFYTAPDEVVVQGIPATQNIRLFSSNGTQYPVSTISDGDNFLTISLSSLPTGVYLITLPNTNIPAIKIVKK